jgi:hypothetical protein
MYNALELGGIFSPERLVDIHSQKWDIYLLTLSDSG